MEVRGLILQAKKYLTPAHRKKNTLFLVRIINSKECISYLNSHHDYALQSIFI